MVNYRNRKRDAERAHSHQYVQHPNPEWSTHVVCTICKFAISKLAVLSYSMVLDRQLSPELLAERRTLQAERRKLAEDRLARRAR